MKCVTSSLMSGVEHDVPTDTLSVDKKHYDDFLSTMYDGRLVGPKVDILIEELLELRQVQRGQKIVIDHPRKGTKDLSDATCGAIFNAIEHTPKPVDQEVEIIDYADMVKQNREFVPERKTTGVIKAPKAPMPDEIAAFISGLRAL